jgi:MFS-type transporter involved in bile tolerance (Atg22 family)
MVGLAILAVQVIALPSTIFTTKKLIPKRWERKSMMIFVVLRFVAVVVLTANIGIRGLIIAIILCWLCMGSMQSLMRSEYANLIDISRSWREFGIFWFVTQISSFIGPVLYGWLSVALGSQKIPLLVFAICMVLGGIWAYYIPRKSAV